MHFACEHRIDGVGLDDFEQLFFDEPFNEALCRHVGLKRRLLRRELSGGTLVREVEVGAERDVPQAVAKLLGTNRFVYTERVTYRWGSNHADWVVTPALLTNKCTMQGTFSFSPSENNAGVVRRVDGIIEVKIFGVGMVIERFVGQEIARSYADAAKFTQAYLKAKGAV